MRFNLAYLRMCLALSIALKFNTFSHTRLNIVAVMFMSTCVSIIIKYNV